MFKRKRLILIIISGLVITAASSVFGFFRGRYVTPILMYHSIDPQADKRNMLAVRPETFNRQMGFLKRNRYNVMPLAEFASLIRDKKRIPPRAVVLTFDDGYRNFYIYAFPILKKYNLPAAMFIITDEVGRPQADRLSWEEIRAMRDSGLITFGSHACGPEPLVKIKSREEVKRQIFDSKRILEEKLAGKINLFSYPEGMFDPEIRQLVIDAGYASAVATHPGLNYPNDDTFALKRLRISERRPVLLVFAWQVCGYHTFLRDYQKDRKRKKNAKR